MKRRAIILVHNTPHHGLYKCTQFRDYILNVLKVTYLFEINYIVDEYTDSFLKKNFAF